MTKLVLGYWRIRGLVAPLQYILEAAGLEYEMEYYDFQGGAENPAYPNKWFEVKNTLEFDFPNLPYLIDGDLRITQSMAIARYIARKAGLLGIPDDASPDQLAQRDMIESTVEDLRMAVVHYGIDSAWTKFRFPNGLPEALPKVLEPIAKWMGEKAFVFGESVSYVDFILYETLDVYKMLNADCLEDHPNLAAFVDRMENLPSMKKFLEAPDRITWPILGPIAQKWGFNKE